jgi:hypothetical protein
LEEPNLSLYTSRMPQDEFCIVQPEQSRSCVPAECKSAARAHAGHQPSLHHQHLSAGTGIVANGPILPNSWASTMAQSSFEYDPEVAINLLKGEGYVIPRRR